VPRIRW